MLSHRVFFFFFFFFWFFGDVSFSKYVRSIAVFSLYGECVCLCVVIPIILDVRLVDVPARVTQEEGHTGFLHLPSAVLALIFLGRRI